MSNEQMPKPKKKGLFKKSVLFLVLFTIVALFVAVVYAEFVPERWKAYVFDREALEAEKRYELMQELNAAAYRGDLPRVKEMIENGVSPNYVYGPYWEYGPYKVRTHSRSGPLHVAAANSHPEVVEYLLDHGADINAPGDANGAVTPLSVAQGETIRKMLLARGAKMKSAPSIAALLRESSVSSVYREPSVRNDLPKEFLEFHANAKDMNSALVIASRLERLDILEALLRLGAPTEVGGTITTPLREAARKGHLDAVKLLLSHGADPRRALDDATDEAVRAELLRHIEEVEM